MSPGVRAPGQMPEKEIIAGVHILNLQDFVQLLFAVAVSVHIPTPIL